MDDLEQRWAAYDARLGRILRIDEALIRDATRRSLTGTVIARVIEIAIGAVLLVLTSRFVVNHLDAPGYLACGLATHVYLIGLVGLSIYQLVLVRRIDCAASIVDAQRAIERAKLAEFRAFLWAFPLGMIVWAPAAIVVLRVLGGDPLAAVSMAWLVANIALGITALALAIVWSARYADRTDLSPRTRRFADALSGRGLRRAARFLAELDES